MNWLALIALALILFGTAAYDWREGLYGSCGFNIILGTAALSAGGLMAAGVHF
ncbi:hypothetical protein ABID82_005056 [Methylobacterium sp. PvP062]|uniref:Uncharacterized protein n=1 Tax=Methylobacterium radiotolerans TaxID=31998 RepID=A0ABV2NU18_9HYPH|nr:MULTISPECIES: hypothetical protein [unclassified Methylobacterium]MBP2498370.1 hypothetical protein [Methylobacterium sp. PvP105]MBP2505754.1 hypothetical protein [Methylobacterium sp. PvP109]